MIGPEGYRHIEPTQSADVKIAREAPFPEEPLERFKAVFAAIGNSEAKCATLLLSSESPTAGRGMQRKFAELLEDSWIPHNSTYGNYFETLSAAGLIAKTEEKYKITDAGEKYGKPIAAFLLQQSSPLFPLESLGTTATAGETRPVVNRIQAISLLSKLDKPISISQLAQELGLESSFLFRHVSALKELGIVNYSTREIQTIYDVVGQKKPSQVHSKQTFQEKVEGVITRMGSANAETIAQKLIKEYPDATSYTRFRERVSKALASLAREGLLKKHFTSGQHYTQIEITPLGIYLDQAVIEPIRSVLSDQDPDLLSSWRKIPWQVYLKHGLEKHRQASSMINRASHAEAISSILRIIEENPGIDKRGIEHILGKNAFDGLSALRQRGLVTLGKRGSKFTYTLTSAES